MREIVCRRERTGSLLDSVLDISLSVGDAGPDVPVATNLRLGGVFVLCHVGDCSGVGSDGNRSLA